jgi:phosphatidylserine decarboxylase
MIPEFKYAPEGYPFIFGALAATVLAGILFFWSWKTGGFSRLSVPLILCALLFSLLTVFMLYFFRDPERKTPSEQGIFVAPADGKIILVRDSHEDRYLRADVKEISIFMSPMDVHVNRAPCDGKVSLVNYSPGKFMAAYKEEAPLLNEHIVMVLDTAWGQVMMRQVAGFVARRAVCRATQGDTLRRGERFGIIKFSSRLDIFLPKDIKMEVKPGDRVRAGETVIGRLEDSVPGILEKDGKEKEYE